MRALVLVALVACSSSSPPPAVLRPPDAATAVKAPAAASREIEPGLSLRTVELDRAGVPMKVWIYRSSAFRGPRPLVLIAPAGTPLIWGMQLADSDRPEHLPWARAGYLVVAYSLDGHVADQEDEAQVRAGVRAFVAAHAGLDNARAALDHVLAHEPDVDAKHIITVGHSSAATLSLRVGAEEPRVTHIVSFNPQTDSTSHIAKWDLFNQVHPDAQTVLTAASPMNHVDGLRRKPVFLFHAEDDSLPIAESERLAKAAEPWHAKSRFHRVPTGGHYDSMLHQGIPAAQAWLHEVDPALPAPR